MSDHALSRPLAEKLAALPPIPGFTLEQHATLRQALALASVGQVLRGQNAFVLYADVLGFRARLMKDAATLEAQLETALLQTNFAILARIHGAVSHHDDGTSTQGPIVGLDKLNPASIFSDSIFVVSHDDSDESLRQICHLASAMFVFFFCQDLPLRGAISHGSVWWNRNTDVRLGEGIRRAYELAESLDCVGVALDAGITPPENSSAEVAFVSKVVERSEDKCLLRVPLQLQRNSLPMGYRADLVSAFERFAERPENRSSAALRSRYNNSIPIIRAMAQQPVSA
jgi:hypothetical protein|nr:hypothetical protein [uncultured Steroidobacter sp.]